MDAYVLSRVKAANGAAADKRLKRRSGVLVCDFEKAHERCACGDGRIHPRKPSLHDEDKDRPLDV